MALALTTEDIERRKSFVHLTTDDMNRLREAIPTVEENADALADHFFATLRNFDEARGVFSDARRLDAARALKRAHILALPRGEYGKGYVDERIKLATLYAAAELPVALFLGTFHGMMSELGVRVVAKLGFEHFVSIRKVGFFDLAIMIDTLIGARDQRIAAQQRAILDLSTPVLQISDRLLIIPLIGVVDTERARQLTEHTLVAVRERRARVVILDVTGVPIVDSKVAHHLSQTINAARMMGADVFVCGISAAIAQSLVALGVTLTVPAVADLQEAVAEAQAILGRRGAGSESRANSGQSF